ncbi:MAG: tetratricopeptide repeat protein, partial [Nitrososphaeraceae archaeon]|nr:tetratricopeptide repeat protein [Nitrososphaeraceae archaeon]
MKDSVRLISKYYRFNIDGFVSYLTTVTMLLTVLLIVSVGSNYQIQNVEAQSTNTSSFSELFEKGNSLGNLGKYEEAISWYDKALEADPKNVDALYNKGVALGYLGRYEEAIIWYDKALEVDPKNVDALYNKGVALDNLGRYQEAIIWYDKALEVDPKHVS